GRGMGRAAFFDGMRSAMSGVGSATGRLTMRPATMLCVLALIASVCVVLFMTVSAHGQWDFVLPLRGRKIATLALVAFAIAVSTVLFQTATGNRILTPSIMVFDALYVLIQSCLVF